MSSRWTAPLRRPLLAWAGACSLFVSCGDPEPGAGSVPAKGTAPATPSATFETARDAAFALERDGADDADVRAALLLAQTFRPEAYGVNVKLGQVSERLGLLAEAVTAYERAHVQRPDDLLTLQALATACVAAGERERAGELLPRLLSHPGQMGLVLLLEVRMLETLSVSDTGLQAAALLERGLAMPPEQASEALIGLGRWFLERGANADARRAFQSALVAEPADTAVLKGLTSSCWRLGLDEEAQRWQEVLELMLGLQDNVFTREQTTRAGEENQRSAIEHSEYIRREMEAHEERLMRLVEIHPAWGDGFLDLAQLQAENGEAAAACATVQAYLERHGPALSPTEQAALRTRYCR